MGGLGPTCALTWHLCLPYPFSEKILKLAANIAGDKLVSLGTCFGKFTKTHKFRLHITALDYLAPYAKVCGVASSRPLGMEEVGEEGHPRTQIVDRVWRQHQHVERFVGTARPRGRSPVTTSCNYLRPSRKACANPAEDRKADGPL